MLIPKSENINTGRLKLENYLTIHYHEFLKYIKEKYNDSETLNESIYRYFNNIDEIPKCPVCGKNTKFINNSKGYSKHCSKKCTQNDKSVREKLKNTLVELYGEDYKKTIVDKTKKTKEERYKDKNYNNSKKAKQTCVEKYGVDNPMKNEAIKDKSKKTCKEKYGSEYWLSSNEFIKNKTKYLEKAKQTCVEKYGKENPVQNEDIKKKIKRTCMEKYNVQWNCMRKEAHNSKNYKSIPNEYFKELLIKNNIKFKREFVLGNFVYDFKINNTLIDINPSATHNVNFNPFSKKNNIDKTYHYMKLKNAKENGFRCIFVFDWDDYNKIISLILNDKTVYARKCEIKEVKNKELKEFLDKNHLQNSCKGQKIKIGLYYKNELIQVMTFGKPRFNNNYQYELLRLCTKIGYRVTGGSKKLFTHFVKKYNPDSIISYCDSSKFSGIVYISLGFTLKRHNYPSCKWVNLRTKEVVNDSLLNKLGFDKLFLTDYGKNTDNKELMRKYRFVQVYDCGQDVYEYKRAV